MSSLQTRVSLNIQKHRLTVHDNNAPRPTFSNVLVIKTLKYEANDCYKMNHYDRTDEEFALTSLIIRTESMRR